MDDIGSYIKYIIIGAILVFRFLAAGKKKEEKPKSRPKSVKRKKASTSTTSLEDILRELSGEPAKAKQPVPEKQYETVSQQRKRKKIEIEDHQHDFRPEHEHHADVDLDLGEVRDEIRESQGLKLEEEETHALSVDFDLRQAIIAQTILNRPSY
ncbi:MAG: hypothetical protein ABF321_04605 [Bacteroidia bacterium]